MIKQSTYEFYLKCKTMYRVTKNGKVFSNNSYRKNIDREMKQTIDRYAYVDLSLGNIKKKIGVHNLVAFEYLGEPPQGHLVCHKDDNKLNNSFDNIYYGTPAQNKIDAFRNNRIPIGEKHQNAKFTDSQVYKMRMLRAQGKTLGFIANEFGASKS